MRVGDPETNALRGLLLTLVRSSEGMTKQRLAEHVVERTKGVNGFQPDEREIIKYLQLQSKGDRNPNLCFLPCIHYLFLEVREFSPAIANAFDDIYLLLYQMYRAYLRLGESGAVPAVSVPVFKSGISPIIDALRETVTPIRDTHVFQVLRISIDSLVDPELETEVLTELLYVNISRRSCCLISYKGQIYTGACVMNKLNEMRMIVSRFSRRRNTYFMRNIATHYHSDPDAVWFAHMNKFGDYTLHSLNTDCYLLPIRPDRFSSELPLDASGLESRIETYLFTGAEQLDEECCLRDFLAGNGHDRLPYSCGAKHAVRLKDLAFIAGSRLVEADQQLFHRPSRVPEDAEIRRLSLDVPWDVVTYKMS